ncbi:hypothetical protein [Nocardioides sp.]|uniref:hypothetical protein n=1 Tax=Nocardioides sp. TaxID=35761 RepID=UPI002BB7DEDE|nr:hypothetical protein [Nocardioides sp.]HXH77327.1 hypothetical protein [Nocardioides sp.]
MSSYLNINELAASPTFRGRVQAAIAVRAAGVLGETEDNAAKAAKRQQLAATILADPATKVNAFIWLVVTNDSVKAAGMATTDNDIEWVIGWAWDQVAGVTKADLAPTPAASTTTQTLTTKTQ